MKWYGQQWRIQDFPRGGGANIQFCQNFPKNCMELKECGPGGASILPPLVKQFWKLQCICIPVTEIEKYEHIPNMKIVKICRLLCLIAHSQCTDQFHSIASY